MTLRPNYMRQVETQCMFKLKIPTPVGSNLTPLVPDFLANVLPPVVGNDHHVDDQIVPHQFVRLQIRRICTASQDRGGSPHLSAASQHAKFRSTKRRWPDRHNKCTILSTCCNSIQSGVEQRGNRPERSGKPGFPLQDQHPKIEDMRGALRDMR